MRPSPTVSPMVIVKTELCEPDIDIKQEPQSLPTLGTNYQLDSLIDLTDNTEDHLHDVIMKDKFCDQETPASPSKDDCHDTTGDFDHKRREELQEDLLSERSKEIDDKSGRKEITEEKNILSKKNEKNLKTSTNKKIDNLRLVRREGFFTINPNKNHLKTFNRIGHNKSTSSR